MTRISLLLGLFALLWAPASAPAQGKEKTGGVQAKAKKPPKVVELEEVLAAFDSAAADRDAAALGAVDDRLDKILRRDLETARREIRRGKKSKGKETATQKKERRALRRAYIERRRISLRLGTLRGKTDGAALKEKRAFIVRLLEMAREEGRDPAKKKSGK